MALGVRRFLAAAALAGLVAHGSAALAADKPAADRPARGAHMAAVEQRYGAPVTRYPAVGSPPIVRWDYPGMVVYFENDRVIHAVLVPPAS
jgi:hypothetical protein